jgi:hypothetical protein
VSAKFRRAPSNQRAPGMRVGSASTWSGCRDARTWQKGQTSCQKRAGWPTDQRHSRS